MTGEGKVLMDRRYFDSQKGNINDMMTQIRAIPNMTPAGAVDGFQLFEIAKDSIYDKVGLKNQDVLQRVNGQPLNSVETGLDLFNALKNDNHFVLDILRNKENKSITVNIQ
jgi:general secretion pathway protein C